MPVVCYHVIMIEGDVPLNRGDVVRHDAGLTYRIDGVRLDTTGYEETHAIGRAVLYTQLEDGELPAGTEYVKNEIGFRRHFTLVD